MGRKKKVDLVRRMSRLVYSGEVVPPLWYEMRKKMPHVPVQDKEPRGQRKLKLPEDRYVKKFFQKYPEAKMVPIRLDSKDPPMARQFAWRQMQLIEMYGYTEEAAFEKAEEELKPSEHTVSQMDDAVHSPLVLAQQDEERVLLQALTQKRGD